jgi:very-short-patch-repair endonuclease
MFAMRPNSQKGEREAALSQLLASNYGLANRSQLRGLGFTDSSIQRLVSSGRISRFLPSVFRSTAVPVTWETRALGGCLRSPGKVWLSHRAAAAHHGFSGCRKGRLEYLSTTHLRPVRDQIIHYVAALPACDIEDLRGIPVTSPARTLLDLAGVVDEETLEVALDDALCTHKVRLARLKWRLDELGTKGKHGPALLAKLLKVRGEGTVVPTTILETKLVRLLRTAQLPIGKAQHVFQEKGRSIARVDFVYPEQRVVIEVDGTRWHAGRRARVRDAERDNYLNIKGWIVLRFTWFDLVERPTYVVEQIREALGVHAFLGPE